MENMTYIEAMTDSTLNEVYDEFEDDMLLVQALEQFEEGKLKYVKIMICIAFLKRDILHTGTFREMRV